MSPKSLAGGSGESPWLSGLAGPGSSTSSLGSLGYFFFSGKGARRLSEDMIGEDTLSSTRNMAPIRALILASIVFPFFP